MMSLHWHQDVAYFPLKPNNQIAVWFPLEAVDKEAGALNYAIGSHKEGIKVSKIFIQEHFQKRKQRFDTSNLQKRDMR